MVGSRDEGFPVEVGLVGGIGGVELAVSDEVGLSLAGEAMVVGEVALEDSEGVIGAREGVEGLEVEELDIGILGGIAAEGFEVVIESGDLHVIGALDGPPSVDQFCDEEQLVIIAGLEGAHLSVLGESESLGMFCGEEVERLGGEAVRGCILGGGGEAFGGPESA